MAEVIVRCAQVVRQWLWPHGVALVSLASSVAAQSSAAIAGSIRDAVTSRPIAQATITLEGSTLFARSDSGGTYRLSGVSPGPQTLVVRALGYSLARVPVSVPASGLVRRDVLLARIALQMPQVRVTAEGIGRARGELGTATVINRDAIQVQNAVSLTGVLELLPGIALQPPGLEATQQVALRSVPTTYGVAERAAAFGTLIIMDGVPLSNNANLQSTGPRGEIPLNTAAGGGIDLRRIPATTLERVEVIRGVPSSRYGDLTAGAIVIDTRAGAFANEAIARFDPSTTGLSLGSGRTLFARHNATLTSDLTRTLVAPGVRDAAVWRGTLNLAHRTPLGTARDDSANVADTRVTFFQVYRQDAEQAEIRPGVASSDRSGGVRVAERLRFGRPGRPHVVVTAAIDREWQNSQSQLPLIRGAEPFTDRLTPGTSVGRFVQGSYVGAVRVQGAPWHLYARAEGVRPGPAWGGERTLRAGLELRRDWTGGPGYQFNIEFPPQVAFNGINGYDRPRRFDDIPAVAASASYIDARVVRALGSRASLDVQAGLRMDALHDAGWWASRVRDAVLQPRVNIEIAPRQWLRLRAGAGVTAKQPGVAELFPAPQYFDVVNVNWFPPNPAERLAVLTTSVVDPTNAQLGYAVAHKSEVGIEVDIGNSGAAFSVVGFRDVTRGSPGFVSTPSFLERAHFALSDTVIGSGRPPKFSPTPTSIDTVPVFVDVPTNLNRIANTGLEWTLTLPEITAIRTRAELTGAWIKSRLTNNALDFGPFARLGQFQVDARQPRTAFWRGDSQRGERALTTARIVHHQPSLALVLTGTVQYFLHERTVQQAATDTLAWAGYVTRTGVIVPVPPNARLDAQYADLRQPRQGLASVPASPPPDWLLSVQATKAILTNGRLSFYAFNALDRLGQPSTSGRAARLFARNRFGLEITLPLSRAR
ncbi:MAG: carboxypeptidase regulatory-like domain-containing protein [Gemmatimonadota bacterium]